MNELIFEVQEAPEGGYTARALGQSIFTEADTLEELRANIREAVQCHFVDGYPNYICQTIAAGLADSGAGRTINVQTVRAKFGLSQWKTGLGKNLPCPIEPACRLNKKWKDHQPIYPICMRLPAALPMRN